MIEKKTFINQITVDSEGIILVQFVKAIVENDIIISREYHRTSILPGEDVAVQLAAVDAHLPKINAAPISDEPLLSVLKRADLLGVAAAAHTPAVVTRFQAKQPPVINRNP